MQARGPGGFSQEIGTRLTAGLWDENCYCFLGQPYIIMMSNGDKLQIKRLNMDGYGGKTMAEMIKAYRQSVGDVRFIGKRYGEMCIRDSQYGAYFRY